MERSLPLNDWHGRNTQIVINRVHAFVHGAALLALFYYRITSITSAVHSRERIPILPLVLLLISELILSFIWVLGQASKWNPVVRRAYPERLPEDEHLPPVDVFVCTADPNKEPSLQVMNTVISALALDYPPHKLHVYLSDDGGSPVTFGAVKEAWSFSKLWIPFCRKYGVKTRSPEAFFFRDDTYDEVQNLNSSMFLVEKKALQGSATSEVPCTSGLGRSIHKAYEEFKKCLDKIALGKSSNASNDHPPLIEVVGCAKGNIMDSNIEKLPLLVYVAREKRPSHPHHFKAGALNVLLRVSGIMSNSDYILVLDCDMYCNDPTSARQAMCFHLDPRLSSKLAFVQFPQKFGNINKTDIYDGQLRFIWQKWEGMDGLRGPILLGTGFYIKREALYGTKKFQDVDFIQMKNYFGSCDEFVKSIYRRNKPEHDSKFTNDTLQKQVQLTASCSYDNDSEWGKEVGFRYFTVVEDYFTSLNLHCSGWTSVYYEPRRPCFLGATPISLGEILVQHTRWYLGFLQVALSKFSPLIYGPPRMPISQSMCYSEHAYYPLYSLALYILAIVPQIYLLQGIPLYPNVSSPFFLVLSFLFLSAQLKHMQEVLATGHSIKTWSIEQRIWMMKSLTSYLYASMEAIKDKIGLTKASFLPTNKVVDDEVEKRYQMRVYDFHAPSLFMLPLCTLYMLNLASFIVGFSRILQSGKRSEMLVQAFIPLFSVILNYPLLEGMVVRKDNGRVSPSVSFLAAVISSVVVAYICFSWKFLDDDDGSVVQSLC